MTVSRSKQILLFAVMAATAQAQRVFEQGNKVIYEDASKQRTDLGVGFDPILMAGGEVVFVRGKRYGYGEEFDCTRPETKNWVAKYDPQTLKETKVFDRPIHYDGPGSLGFCAFEQMQISYEGSVLYLLASTYATSGNLAIVNLTSGSLSFVPGVIAVFVIESGPHQNELVYQRRVWRKSPNDGLEYPSYPFIHALADGRQITEISDENFTVGGNDKVPVLRKYLREIDGTIHANGQKLP
jgi:hypothetical protein